jgi:hypothetical protein
MGRDRTVEVSGMDDLGAVDAFRQTFSDGSMSSEDIKITEQ